MQAENLLFCASGTEAALAVANDRVLLVSPPNRIVVGVFSDVKGPAASEGRGR